LASELEVMTKRNPLGTIAGAVMVGVLIGLLARRRTA
jgi:LPXTG-motif cell wall-anchored protein